MNVPFIFNNKGKDNDFLSFCDMNFSDSFYLISAGGSEWAGFVWGRVWDPGSLSSHRPALWSSNKYFSDFVKHISCYFVICISLIPFAIFLLQVEAGRFCVEAGGTLSSLWARDSLGLGPLLRPARAVGQLESGWPGTLSALVAPPSFTCCVWTLVGNSQFHYFCKMSHFTKSFLCLQ